MRARQSDNARITVLTTVPEIVTHYAPMRAVLALVERTAPSDAAVVISGEAGTGKSLIAQLIHRWSARAAAPLADVRCGGVPSHALANELFGEDPEAVADGSGRGAGLLARAAGGTIFLKEIGALDGRMQGLLLRALERRSGRHVGATAAGAPVRVIASTRDDLAQRVADGLFQAQLLARLSTVHIVLPPLRERIVDVRPLAEHVLRTRGGRRSPALSEEAVEALEAYGWPGNVRELQSVVQRAALLARGGIIRAAHLPLGHTGTVNVAHVGDGLISLEELERRHIQLVLERVGWHQGHAAGILGISPKTLYRKMRGFGLRRPTRSPRRTEQEHMA